MSKIELTSPHSAENVMNSVYFLVIKLNIDHLLVISFYNNLSWTLTVTHYYLKSVQIAVCFATIINIYVVWQMYVSILLGRHGQRSVTLVYGQTA